MKLEMAKHATIMVLFLRLMAAIGGLMRILEIALCAQDVAIIKQLPILVQLSNAPMVFPENKTI